MKKSNLLLFGLLVIHFLFLLNLRFTAWPEMLSFPYMISKGLTIYKDFHHVYQPLLTVVLFGFYKLFGFTSVSLKIFTWVCILCIDLVIFVISKKIIGNKITSFIPLAIFIFIQPVFEGNMLWYDLGVIPSILAGIYFVISWSQSKSSYYIFLTGLFLSISFLTKQQSALLYIPFILFLLLNKIKIREFVKFVVGSLLPIICLLVVLISLGIFNDYFFWTFLFPFGYLPKIPGYAILPNTREWLTIAAFCFVPLIGFAVKSKKISKIIYFLFAVFIIEIISAFPRFSFFHLQPALSSFVLIVGYLIAVNDKRIKSILLFLVILTIIPLWKSSLRESTYETRFYGKEEISFAKKVSEITPSKDKIYFLGPSSLIYVLSDKTPPKPWIENYVWHFEIPGIQNKVISGWEKDAPKYIYWSVPSHGNWYDLGTYQPKDITSYINSKYVKSGKIGDVEVWKLKE